MKNQKLSLSDLKVNSFITSLENQKTNTVKGGTTPACEVAITVTIVSIAATVTSIIIMESIQGNGCICNSHAECTTPACNSVIQNC